MDVNKLVEYIDNRILYGQSHPYDEMWDGGLCTAFGEIRELALAGQFD